MWPAAQRYLASWNLNLNVEWIIKAVITVLGEKVTHTHFCIIRCCQRNHKAIVRMDGTVKLMKQKQCSGIVFYNINQSLRKKISTWTFQLYIKNNCFNIKYDQNEMAITLTPVSDFLPNRARGKSSSTQHPSDNQIMKWKDVKNKSFLFF